METPAPEKAAKDILLASWCTSLLSCPLPIDPIRIAGDLGLRVYTIPVGDQSVAGMLVKQANEDPVIYLNQADHQNRQRFTCAHEIGHYTRRAAHDGEAWEFVDYRSTLSSRGTDSEEIYANQFAAALLMPTEMVRQMSEVYGKTGLALLFQVSVEAMGHRLSTLGISQG